MRYQHGAQLGSYEIVSLLASGGMGEVYVVRNTISDRLEAMKVLLPELLRDAHFTARFMREIKLHAQLRHPNIVQIHTALKHEEALLMLMELVEGPALVTHLERGRVSMREAVTITVQVLDALEYAHGQGVIHRDIKPANILLTPAGLVKLTDFGIARPEGVTPLTQTGAFLGSVYYMSPEQVKALPLDIRTDIYSLGVTLYEMVAGERPHEGKSEYEVMKGHLELTPAPLKGKRPQLPQALEDAILRAMAKNPAERFESAAAFRAALRALLAELPEQEDLPVAEPARNRLSVSTTANQVATAIQHAASQATLDVQQVSLTPPPRPGDAPLPATRPGVMMKTAAMAKSRPLGVVLVALLTVAVALGAVMLRSWRNDPALPVTRPPASATENAKTPTTAPDSSITSLPRTAEPLTAASPSTAHPVRPEPATPPGNKTVPTTVGSTAPATTSVTPAPAPTPPSAHPPADPNAKARAEWETLSSSNDLQALRSFRARYEGSPQAQQAEQRIQELEFERARASQDIATLQEFAGRHQGSPLGRAAQSEAARLEAEARSKREAERMREEVARSRRPAEPAPTAPDESNAVLQVLSAYQAAFTRKDVRAIQALWPSLSRDALGRLSSSFKEAKQVQFTLRPVGPVQFQGEEASVRCQRSVLMNFDSAQPVSRTDTVNARLRRAASGWVIQSFD